VTSSYSPGSWRYNIYSRKHGVWVRVFEGRPL
jgi:hypothetical protein